VNNGEQANASELVVRKPATKPKSKGRSPVAQKSYAEAREKSDEIIKQAEAAVKRAKEVVETSRELQLDLKLKHLRRLPEIS